MYSSRSEQKVISRGVFSGWLLRYFHLSCVSLVKEFMLLKSMYFVKEHIKKMQRKSPSILLFYQLYLLQSCSPYIPSVSFLSVYLKCPQDTYLALYILFNFVTFVDFTPEITNSAACGETINFAVLRCILKTLMSLLLMYLSQRDRAFKITLVLFFAPFFFSFLKVFKCTYIQYRTKALGSALIH